MEYLKKSKNKSIVNNYRCLVCSNQEAIEQYFYHYNNKSSQILKCTHCGHLYIQPIPLINLDDRTMNTIEDAEFEGSGFLKKLQKKLVIEKEIKIVKRILKTNNPSMLDLGCGTGWTSAVWRDHGFNVTGLEPSESRSKIARERHRLEISNAHIENYSPQELFDVVIMRHLFEHIEDPTQVLAKIKTFLKPNGLLVIVIPNINCIGRYLFKENWEWILPWHLHFYQPNTLSRLVVNNGFEKVKLYQMPSPLWYPSAIRKTFGIKAAHKSYNLLNLALSAPIIFLGLILNLNDNMTLIAKVKKN